MGLFTASILFNMLILILLIIGYVKLRDQKVFRIGAGVGLLSAWGLGFYTAETLNLTWYFIVMIYFTIAVHTATIWHHDHPNLFKSAIIISAIVFFCCLFYVKVLS